MTKRKRLDKKKRVNVRERQWAEHHDTAFSRDLARHRRAQVKLPESSQYRSALPEVACPNATVVSHARKWAFVVFDDAPDAPTEEQAHEAHICLIDERLEEHQETLLAPGDRVQVDRDEEDPVIRGVAARATTLTRCAGVHGRLSRQVIAANVDLLVIVAAVAHPPFRPGLVDRFLIAARQGGVEPLLCVNKMDLVQSMPEEVDLYTALGVSLCATSCHTGEGIETLRERLTNRTSVLAGHSGVGKTSLLNHLDPNIQSRTLEISEASRRGRHATTASRLYILRDNIRIIDTPGIRALGLWNVDPEEVALYFPEIAELGMACKFRNCTHILETGCAVRQAADEGSLSPERYGSYKRIRASIEAEKPFS